MQTYCKIILMLRIPLTDLFKFCVSKKKPCIIEVAAKRVTSVKTLKKWQEEFKMNRKVNRIRCQQCSHW